MFFSLFEYSLIHKPITFTTDLCPDLPRHSRVQVVFGISREILHKNQNTLENLRLEERFWFSPFFQFHYNFPNKSLILQHMYFSCNAVYSTSDGHKVTWSAWIPMVPNVYKFWLYVTQKWVVFSWNNIFLKDDLILLVCNTEYLPEIPRLRWKYDYLSRSLMTEIRKVL